METIRWDQNRRVRDMKTLIKLPVKIILLPVVLAISVLLNLRRSYVAAAMPSFFYSDVIPTGRHP